MAIKRVSVSGLPNANKAELKNTDEYPKTSFLVSIKQSAEFLNTSKQLSYKHLYDALSSLIASLFNIAELGSATTPIYIDSTKKFKAATKNVGNCSYDGHTCTPIYMWNGALTPATSLIGSTTKPIYMDNGTLKESNENVGGSNTDGTTFTPIYMKAGELVSANVNVGGCSYDDHTCTPIYMWNGALTPATSTIGSTTKPIYMDNGTLKETSENVGSSTLPVYLNNGNITAINGSIGSNVAGVYLENGIFKPCLPATPPIGFTSMALKYLVVFSNNSAVGDTDVPEANDPYRLLYTGTYNVSDNKLVQFYIDEDGWYVIFAEGGSNSVFGVIQNIAGSWSTKIPGGLFDGEIENLNVLYCNAAVKSSMCALLPFKAGTTIGITPRLIISDGNEIYVPMVKSSGTTTSTGTTISKKIEEGGSNITLTETTTGKGSWNDPWSSSAYAKKTLNFNDKNNLWNAKKYIYAYRNTSSRYILYIYKDKIKIRLFKFGSSSGTSAMNWGNRDSILILKCNF